MNWTEVLKYEAFIYGGYYGIVMLMDMAFSGKRKQDGEEREEYSLEDLLREQDREDGGINVRKMLEEEEYQKEADPEILDESKLEESAMEVAERIGEEREAEALEEDKLKEMAMKAMKEANDKRRTVRMQVEDQGLDVREAMRHARMVSQQIYK